MLTWEVGVEGADCGELVATNIPSEAMPRVGVGPTYIPSDAGRAGIVEGRVKLHWETLKYGTNSENRLHKIKNKVT